MNKKFVILLVLILCFQSTGCSGKDNQKEIDFIRSYINEEQYEKAIVELDEYNTKNGRTLDEEDYYYGVCYNRLGLYKLAEEAIDYYQTDHDDIKGNYEKAITLYGTADYEKANQLFESIKDAYLDNPEYFYYYGNSCYYNKKYADAARLLEKAVDLDPKQHTYNIDLLYAYSELEEYNKGIEACNNYLKILGEKKEVNSDERDQLEYQRGDFYYNAGQYEAALSVYSKLLDESDDPYYECYYIARCYAKMEDYQNTYIYLRKSFEYDIYYYYDEYKSDGVFKDFFADKKYGKMMEDLEAE